MALEAVEAGKRRQRQRMLVGHKADEEDEVSLSFETLNLGHTLMTLNLGHTLMRKRSYDVC